MCSGHYCRSANTCMHQRLKLNYNLHGKPKIKQITGFYIKVSLLSTDIATDFKVHTSHLPRHPTPSDPPPPLLTPRRAPHTPPTSPFSGPSRAPPADWRGRSWGEPGSSASGLILSLTSPYLRVTTSAPSAPHRQPVADATAIP